MNSRFALLDVIKSQKTSKEKDAEDTLKLTNKLKIITAPDDVFNLWSEIISSAAHGELVDPDKMLKFNEKAGWKPETGNLSHEFFRWLGNWDERDGDGSRCRTASRSSPCSAAHYYSDLQQGGDSQICSRNPTTIEESWEPHQQTNPTKRGR